MAVAATARGRWPGAGPVAELIPGLPVWTVPLVLCLVALAATLLFWGEEFGWTAYLLVRIFPGRPRTAALVAGLVASVWHFPLAVLGYIEYGNLALGLAGWTAWIMYQEVLLAWLRDRSGSVWPACLAHSGNNMVLAPLTTAMLFGADGGLGYNDTGVQWLVVLVLAALTAVALLRHR